VEKLTDIYFVILCMQRKQTQRQAGHSCVRATIASLKYDVNHTLILHDYFCTSTRCLVVLSFYDSLEKIMAYQISKNRSSHRLKKKIAIALNRKFEYFIVITPRCVVPSPSLFRSQIMIARKYDIMLSYLTKKTELSENKKSNTLPVRLKIFVCCLKNLERRVKVNSRQPVLRVHCSSWTY